MQIGLVHLHNLLRWIILILLVASIIKSYGGWKQKKIFAPGDKKIWLFTLITAHITLLIGLYQWLFGRYGILVTSLPPGVSVMKDKFYRFFWVEHPTGMILSILLITLGYGMAKKAVSDETKFRRAFWYFTIALLIILITVPWPFRQIVGRPLFPGMH
ncbi:MAG: hypothetical protein ABI813_11695 [Bacteroidota bacterium]